MSNVYRLFPEQEDIERGPETIKQQLENLFYYVAQLEATIKHLELRINELEDNNE